MYTVLYWQHEPSTKVYRDSKKVAEKKRNMQFDDIVRSADIGFVSCAISPYYISLNMLNNARDTELKKLKGVYEIEKSTKKIEKGIKLGTAKIVKNKITGQANIIKRHTQANIASIVAAYNATILHSRIAQQTNTHTQSTEIRKNEKGIVLYKSNEHKNLNELSLQCVSNILRQHIVPKHIEVEQVYMDKIEPEHAVHKMIQDALEGCKAYKGAVVEAKADDTYQVVSAASIVAKVVRG